MAREQTCKHALYVEEREGEKEENEKQKEKIKAIKVSE